MSRRTFGLFLAAAFVLGCAGSVWAQGNGRSMPFNKENVLNYLQRVQAAKRGLPEKLGPEEYQERICRLYADTMKQAGYDFEHSVENAMQFAEKGGSKLDDPRFLFLAGVFQVHPDEYQRVKLISKATRDAVMHYFGH